MDQIREMEQMKELNTLWYEPWWTKVNWGVIIPVMMLIILTIVVILHLKENKNYLRYWQKTGRVILRIIVLAETLYEAAKAFPTMLSANLKKENALK